MNYLDLKTILFSYVISNTICLLVMVSLWHQHHKDRPEIGFWLVDYALQFVAILLIFLRGSVSIFISAIGGNLCVIAGTLLLYMGLERYVGKKSSYFLNYGLLLVFILAHIYFLYYQPNLAARNINLSFALLVICFQSAWLMLRRVDREFHPATRMVGMVFSAYCLFSILRIGLDASLPSSNDLFQSGVYDTSVILIYQMLYITLTFTLFLMVNRRLFTRLEIDILARKRSEAALRLSEEKFSIAFHNIPDALAITLLPDGKIIEVNESFYPLSGYAREEILGKSTVELNMWQDPKQRDQFIQNLYEFGKVINFETRFQKKSGEVFDCLISGELIQLQVGKCILNVVRDISDRKRVEREIERAASFPRLNPNPVLEVDSNRRVVFANEAARKKVTDLGISGLDKLISADMDPLFIPEQGRVKGSYEFELDLAGCVFHESVYYFPVDQNFHLYLTDITEQKHTENRLKEANAKLEILFNLIPVGLSVLDQNQEIVITNPALGKILKITEKGLQKGDYRGRKYFRPDGSPMPQEEFASSRISVERTPALNIITGVEVENGEIIWTEVSGVACDFSAWKTILVTSDITHRKQIEEKIRIDQIRMESLLTESERSRMVLLSLVEDQKIKEKEILELNCTLEQRVHNRTAQLEASNKELESFAYSISHDLRAPLRGIDGFSRLLMENYSSKLDSEGVRFLRIILDSTRKMDHLITDILALSRVSSSEMEFILVDMKKLIQSVLQEFTSPEVNQKISFILGDLPQSYGDPVLLRQVWTNLISNSIKYTLPKEEGRIEIHGILHEAECIYSVSDNGVGFNPKYVDKLFTLFQRLHKETEFEGTGVGLAIVKRIVLRHRGRVWAESEEGKGAKFFFSIPLRTGVEDGYPGV
jgi:PAS domain S-box-containing protein